MTPAIFFDDGKGELGPLTDLRPAFDLRTGALRSIERMRLVLGLKVVALFVPEPLAALTLDKLNIKTNELPDLDGPVLVVNGRCPIPLDEIREIEPGQALVERKSGDVIAARLEPRDAKRFLEGEPPDLDTQQIDEHVLLSRPWHFRSVRDLAIESDMEILRRRRRAAVPDRIQLIGDADDAIIDPDARILPGVTLDLTHGPVVVSAGAVVRPGAVLCGPVALGPNSTVLDGTLVKPNTAIGPVCKVAGEVGGCVFQGYANKAHGGHLGDSWIGEWVNIGAGTNNSNLLNTYGEVSARATPDGPTERTGEMYLGLIAGDHAKFAIGSRIMTGAVVHTGAMLASSHPVRGCVPPFCWCTDENSHIYRQHKFLDVMRTVMGRRDIEPSRAYLDRIAALHAAEAARLAERFKNT